MVERKPTFLRSICSVDTSLIVMFGATGTAGGVVGPPGRCGSLASFDGDTGGVVTAVVGGDCGCSAGFV